MNALVADWFILILTLVPVPKNLPEERGFRDQTSAEFQKTFNEMHPQGWRLKRIKGFEKDGDSRFDSDWNRPAEPPRFWCAHGISRDEYDSRATQLKNDGYIEVLKSAWKVGGKDKFWAVWELK